MHKATKAEVRSVLSSQFPAVQPTGDSEPVKVTGTLRAINLEEGVIQVRTSDTETIRVSGLKGEAEDVIGPLLNRSVVVDTMKQGSSYSYVDIDATED